MRRHPIYISIPAYTFGNILLHIKLYTPTIKTVRQNTFLCGLSVSKESRKNTPNVHIANIKGL